MLHINGELVWDVDGVPTVIRQVRGRFAKGAILHDDLELEPCWIARSGRSFAHGATLAKAERDARVKDLEELAAFDPSVEVSPENLGIGSLVIHALTAPYIEVAGDGKTAQGLWYSPGAVGGVHPGRADGMKKYEKYGVDFIKEDGAWKIWHLFIGTDFATPAGQDLKGDTILEQERKIAAGEMEKPKGPPIPDDPNFIPMDAYSLRYNYSFYPHLPEPYYSFDECVSNGPEGNPNYKKEVK